MESQNKQINTEEESPTRKENLILPAKVRNDFMIQCLCPSLKSPEKLTVAEESSRK